MFLDILFGRRNKLEDKKLNYFTIVSLIILCMQQYYKIAQPSSLLIVSLIIFFVVSSFLFDFNVLHYYGQGVVARWE